MIAVEDVRKNYGPRTVLRGLSLRAEPEEITLLVGPNGAGNSTTMKILAGLIQPSGGRVQLNGFDVVRRRIEAQRSLAYLPQSPSFHPRLTCSDVLRFYARLRGISNDRCRSVLTLTELTEFARVRIGALSGGTRQRLGLALLLLADAPVLLLDEPGLSLDPGWRKRLQKILHQETKRGKTVLITTHLVAEWNGVAARCLLCRDGAIERELDPSDLPHDFDQSSGCDRTFANFSSIDPKNVSARRRNQHGRRGRCPEESDREQQRSRFLYHCSAGRRPLAGVPRRAHQSLFPDLLRARIIWRNRRPALISGSSAGSLALLYAQTLLLTAVFLSLGLAAGFLAHDRAQALITGVNAWLFLLVGLDLIALFAARWPILQSWPDAWAAALMLNPLDAFRIEALFALEQIPAEAANKTPLANWWIAHATGWFTLISIFGSLVLITIAGVRLNHWEE